MDHVNHPELSVGVTCDGLFLLLTEIPHSMRKGLHEISEKNNFELFSNSNRSTIVQRARVLMNSKGHALSAKIQEKLTKVVFCKPHEGCLAVRPAQLLVEQLVVETRGTSEYQESDFKSFYLSADST